MHCVRALKGGRRFCLSGIVFLRKKWMKLHTPGTTPLSCKQIVGWGQSNRPNKRVQHLEFADIHLQTRDTCRGRYNDQLLLCAGGDPSGKDTCFGDSGRTVIDCD